jgi:hypothetical protein
LEQIAVAETWDGDVLEGPCVQEEREVFKPGSLPTLTNQPEAGSSHPGSDARADCDNHSPRTIKTIHVEDNGENQTNSIPSQVKFILASDIDDSEPGCLGDQDLTFQGGDAENGAVTDSCVSGETSDGLDAEVLCSQESADVVNEVLRNKMEKLSNNGTLELSHNPFEGENSDQYSHRKLNRDSSFCSDTSETIVDFTLGEGEEDDFVTIQATKLTPSTCIRRTDIERIKSFPKRTSKSVGNIGMQKFVAGNLLISGDFRSVSFSMNPPLMEFPETLSPTYAFRDESERYRYHKHQMTKSKSVPELQVGNFEVGLQIEIVTNYKYDDNFTYDIEYDDTSWVWVSGSGCRMDSVATVPWFSKFGKSLFSMVSFLFRISNCLSKCPTYVDY